jgi:hypothetical protein
MVCKTIIRRFNSARRLHLLSVLLVACSDPPDPPPAAPTLSTAKWVEWRADDAPVERPVVVFVDEPGGSVDRIAANADVTTFLNDRFHPRFHTTDAEQPVGTVQFLSADGCALTLPLTPTGPADFIAAANAVVVRDEAVKRTAPRFTRSCANPPLPVGAPPPITTPPTP